MRQWLPALFFLFALSVPHAAWERIPKPPGMPQFGDIAIGPGGNIYSFTYGAVWHSADRGASFQKSAMTVTIGGTPFDSASLSRFAPVAAPSGSLFQSVVATAHGTERQAVLRSRDQGKTWTSVGDAEGVVGARIFASPKGEIYAADMFAFEYDNDTVWVSRDDGDTWKQAGIFERIMSMAVDPDGSVFVIGYRVGEVQHIGSYNLFKTADGGAHWDSLGRPYGFGGEPSLAANRKGCLAVAYTRGLWTSTSSAPALALSADSDTYIATRTEILFAPQDKLLIAVDQEGVLAFPPPFSSHASLNDGLGRDSTADFRDMQFDDEDNLYLTAQLPAYPDVNLYVRKASGSGIRGPVLRMPAASSPQAFDLIGRRLLSTPRARLMIAGFPPR